MLIVLAPCTLPFLPGYIGFISGVSSDELGGPAARRKVFLNGLVFYLGWSVVLIFFGTIAGFVGAALAPYRILLTRIGGGFVILFGLSMLGRVKLPFFGRMPAGVPQIWVRSRPLNSFALGLAFGLGWTPCVGPVLGTVLFLASTSATASSGAALLAIFSLGFAVPFLAIALAAGSAQGLIRRLAPCLGVVSAAGGLVLVLIGALMVMDRMGLIVSSAYDLFRFMNYGRLLDYL